MKIEKTVLAIAVALLLPVAAHAAPAPSQPVFAVRLLAPGVHLFAPADGDVAHTNAVVAEREDGLLVAGAQPRPEAAKELLAAIAEAIPGAPVRYLVILHASAEASGGAAAFPPSVLVIGSEGARAAFADPSFDPGGAAKARAGEGWTEPPRPRVVLALSGSTLLDDPRVPVQLVPIAPAHTRGDVVVRLPSADLTVGGALLFPDRNPYAGDAHLGGWMNALNNFVVDGGTAVVPLRGAPLGNRELRLQRDAMAWVRGEVESAYIDRLPSDRIPARVLGADKLEMHLDRSLSPSFLSLLAEVAVREAREQRRKYGLKVD
jgi:cyclase